jgi:hypothetical protein
MKLAFVIRLQFARDAATKPGLPQFRSIEMATLEQGNGQFKQPSLTSVECEFRSALRHRTRGFEPILIIMAVSSDFPLNDDPSPTPGTCHAQTQNAIGHSEIIKVIEPESAARGWHSFSWN